MRDFYRIGDFLIQIIDNEAFFLSQHSPNKIGLQEICVYLDIEPKDFVSALSAKGFSYDLTGGIINIQLNDRKQIASFKKYIVSLYKKTIIKKYSLSDQLLIIVRKHWRHFIINVQHKTDSGYTHIYINIQKLFPMFTLPEIHDFCDSNKIDDTNITALICYEEKAIKTFFNQITNQQVMYALES